MESVGHFDGGSAYLSGDTVHGGDVKGANPQAEAPGWETYSGSRVGENEASPAQWCAAADEDARL